ncbi:MAG: hypothetical protein R6U63_13870 [Longimicrobiales bacterium]
MEPRRERMPPYYEPMYQGRPLQYVTDKDGQGWLCDKGVSKWSDLRKVGCWRCDEIAFPIGH